MRRRVAKWREVVAQLVVAKLREVGIFKKETTRRFEYRSNAHLGTPRL